jgi:hypothetical protein
LNSHEGSHRTASLQIATNGADTFNTNHHRSRKPTAGRASCERYTESSIQCADRYTVKGGILAVAIRTTDIHRDHRAVAVPAPRARDLMRTECLTPLAVTAGVVLWGMIILLVRAFV